MKTDNGKTMGWRGSVSSLTALTAAIAGLMLIGCGSGHATSGSATTGSGGSSASNSASASASASSSGSGSTGTGGGGPGTISGTVGSHKTTTVASAYLIGMSDDPAHTTVVYVFDQPVACSQISNIGWDKVVTDKTGALEMKLVGKMPGKYPVATGPTPAQGEASVNFTETSTTMTPVEQTANGGSVQLDTVQDGKLATGSFHLTFPMGMLDGTFNAPWCAGGHEP